MKTKSIIGIILIAGSVAGMYFWETNLRERMLFTKVLAAAVDIEEGDIAGKDSFKEISISSESLVAGFLKNSEAEELYGKECVFPLKANAVVSKDCFRDGREYSNEGKYCFGIPYGWIYEGSLIPSAGYTVMIYSMPSRRYMGEFKTLPVASDETVTVICALESYFELVSEIERNSGARFLLVPVG